MAARKNKADLDPPLVEQRLSRKKPAESKPAAPSPAPSAVPAAKAEPKVVESGVLPTAEYAVEYDGKDNYRVVVGGKASPWVHVRFVAAVEKDGVVFFALSDNHELTTLLPTNKVLVSTALPSTEVLRQKK